jgi:2-isopropylmalate synthase
MSGLSNVRYWMRAHGFDGTDDGLCAHVFEAAKRGDRTFTDAEVVALAAAYLATVPDLQEAR